jgi:hypothetical protein
MLDPPEPLSSFEVRPPAVWHVHAGNACATLGARMTNGLFSSISSSGAQLPSLSNEGHASGSQAPRMRSAPNPTILHAIDPFIRPLALGRSLTNSSSD